MTASRCQPPYETPRIAMAWPARLWPPPS